MYPAHLNLPRQARANKAKSTEHRVWPNHARQSKCCGGGAAGNLLHKSASSKPKTEDNIGAAAEEHEQQRGHSLLCRRPKLGLRADQAFIAAALPLPANAKAGIKRWPSQSVALVGHHLGRPHQHGQLCLASAMAAKVASPRNPGLYGGR